MTEIDDLTVALSALQAALDDLGVAWAIGGSIASAFYGEPRATNDVDVIVDMTEAQARRLTELLGEGFYADPDTAEEAARHRRSFNVIDTRSFIKIDIFVPAEGPLGLGQLVRRTYVNVLPGLAPLPVLGAEDVILQKLRWFRIGGETSERQWRDLVSVLSLVDDLDQAYLDAAARGAGLEDLLARARNDAREDG